MLTSVVSAAKGEVVVSQVACNDSVQLTAVNCLCPMAKLFSGSWWSLNKIVPVFPVKKEETKGDVEPQRRLC